MTIANSLASLGNNLTQRLHSLHQRALSVAPALSRVAFALYDNKTDLLKTYIHSTHQGHALTHYQFKLSDSPSLSKIAESAEPRLIENIQETLSNKATHSQWLLEQGYRSSYTVPLYNRGEFIGVLFFDADQCDVFDLQLQKELLLISNLIAMALALEFDAIRSITASTEVANEFIHLRDFETGAHLERMALYTQLIANQLAEKYQLTDEYIERVYRAAPLHDIGKIGIPDSILLKPGKLDQQEWQNMQSHVEKGEHIAERILHSLCLNDCINSKLIINVIGQHHEFLDGSGYPRQLSGDEISLEARMVTVADIFDALTSSRPYKHAWSLQDAFDELYRMVELGKIDINCVDALAAQQQQILSIIKQHQD